MTKKTAFLCLILFMLSILCGCGGGEFSAGSSKGGNVSVNVSYPQDMRSYNSSSRMSRFSELTVSYFIIDVYEKSDVSGEITTPEVVSDLNPVITTTRINYPETVATIKEVPVGKKSFVIQGRNASNSLTYFGAFDLDVVTGVNRPGKVFVSPWQTLPKPGAVKGIVTDTITGNPISGISINIGGNISAASGRDGTYIIQNVPAGDQNIFASASGFFDYNGVVNVVSEETVIHNFQMIPVSSQFGSVTGRVTTGADNTAIAGAVVSIGTYSAVANADGIYYFSEIPVGTHTVSATAVNYQNYSGTVIVNSYEIVNHNIQMAPVPPQTGKVTGIVKDSVTDSPIANAFVSIGAFHTNSAADGTYTIQGLPFGTYDVFASLTGYVDYEEQITVNSIATLNYNIPMEKILPTTGTVTGVVTSTSTFDPIEGVEVSIGEISDITTAAGVYTLVDVPEGAHTINAVLTGYLEYNDPVNVTAGQTLTKSFSMSPQPPIVTGKSPEGMDVEVNVPITVTFSKPMNQSSAENAFSIVPYVGGTFAWSGNTMTFTPSANYEYFTDYTVTISTTAKDLTGTSLVSAYSWTFTTKVEPDTTPPTVTGESPVGTSVPVNTPITVTFSEPMNQLSAQGAFIVAPSIGGTFSWSGNTMIYTPSSNYEYSTLYTVTIANSAKDLAGNSLASPYSWEFTTENEPDLTPPVVTVNLPTGVDVPVNAPVSVTFSEPMNQVSVEGAFSIEPYVGGTHSWSGNTMTFTPSSSYDYSTTYTINITTSAKDLAGNSLESTFAWNFTTEAEPDIIPPTITNNLPTGTEVPVNAPVSVTFSEPMNQASAESAFSITPTVDGSFSWSGNEMIFTPSANYSYSADYTVKISTAAKDLAGNSMTALFSWTFTTEAAPDTTPPTITNNLPTGTEVSINSPVKITFSEPMDQASAESAFSIAPTVAGSFSWLGNEMTYTLSENYLYSTTYTVTIVATAKDLAGNFIVEPFAWDFTTEEAPDTTPPTVTNNTPTGTDVPVNTPIIVTFSEPMNQASVEEAFGINPGISGTFSWTGNEMTYTLSENYAYSTLYSVTVAATASDLAGNPITEAFLWDFTTEVEPDTTPPAVTNHSPEGTDVEVNVPISVTFSEPMNQLSAEGAFSIDPNVPGNLSWSGNEMIFTPSGNYTYSTTYTVTISTAAKDLAGNYMTLPHSWGFTTTVEPDTTPPVVTNHSPEGTDVEVNVPISVTFSEPMNQLSAEGAFSIDPNVPGNLSWSGNEMIFTPSGNYTYSTTYTVTISTAAKDLAGNYMTLPHSWGFTTTVEPDTTPPVVTNHSPEGTDVEVNVPISVTFSEPMNQLSAEGAFSIDPNVPGNLSWSGNEMIFTPSSNYNYSTTYTVTISTAAKDLAGNYMTLPHSWGFTTTVEPDTTPPAVTNHSPEGTDVEVNVPISVTFSEPMNQLSAEGAFSIDPNVPGNLSWSGNEMIFTPSSNYNYSTTYTVTISTAAKDLAGNYMTLPHSWGFTTTVEPDTTPPVVTDYTPTGTDVAINTPVTVTFSEPMNQGSAEGAFSINPYVPGNFSWSGNEMTYTLSENYGYSTTYTVTVSTAAKDLAGNYMTSSHSWDFTTTVEPDTTPPTVTDYTPTGTDVAINTPVTVTFSEPMNQLSTEGAFSINPYIETSPSWDGNTMMLTPTTTYDYSTTYTVTISTAAMDLSGNSLMSDESWNFTTTAEPDTTPPTITNHNPIIATDISVNTSIWVMFSEPMNTESAENAFSMTPHVEGSYSWVGNKMIYTPTTALAYNSDYTVTISTAAKDLAGNHLVESFNWSFSTEVDSGGVTPSSWAVKYNAPGCIFNSIFFYDPNNGIVVGNEGEVLRSSDGGETWVQVDPPAGYVGAKFNAVYFPEPSNGFIVGYECILQSTDGGMTWTTNYGLNGSMRDVTAIHSPKFDNTRIIAAAAGNRSMLYSHNGGNSWSISSGSITRDVFDVYMLDANVAWAVGFTGDSGQRGYMYKTTDGGVTWTSEIAGNTTQSRNQTLRSLDFYDTSAGCAVGDAGFVMFTTDGGTNWFNHTIPGMVNLRGVKFTSPTEGWIVGDAGKIYTFEISGGVFAETLVDSCTSSNLRSVYFISPYDGWAAGASGTVIRYSREPEAAGTVTGFVRDASKQTPIEGVEVAIGEISVFTDPEGRYTLTNIDAGIRMIRAYLPGYTLYLNDTEDIVAGGHVEHDVNLEKPYQFISSGGAHSLALTIDGGVWAWGSTSNGALGNNITTPDCFIPVEVHGGEQGIETQLQNIKAVSAGFNHSLALDKFGGVWTWGSNANGRLGIGTETGLSAVPVRVHSGDQNVVPNTYLRDIIYISAGNAHNLAIDKHGFVWAWGDNSSRQIGDGSSTTSPLPVRVHSGEQSPDPYLKDIVVVSAGQYHSLALDKFGGVWAWGSAQDGKLGNGDTGSHWPTPVRVLSGEQGGQMYLEGIVGVSAGTNHSIALDKKGFVYTWGSTQYGQLGNNNTSDTFSAPVRVHRGQQEGDHLYLKGIVSISSSFIHNVAMDRHGRVWSWGAGGAGRLGNGGATTCSTPVHVLGGSQGDVYLQNIWLVSAGTVHNSAADPDGNLWTWGEGLNGRLGNNDTTTYYTPVQVHGGQQGEDNFKLTTERIQQKLAQISGGVAHTLAIDYGGSVWAWGNNLYYQLGNGLPGDKTTPVRVKGYGGSGTLMEVSEIAGGLYHSVALKKDGTVLAWGLNNFGQLGDSTQTQREAPVYVLDEYASGSLQNIKSVAAGQNHTLALMSGGTVWAWGDNQYGQVGDGVSGGARLYPVQVKDSDNSGFLTDITTIACGKWHSMALREDGTVWTWGDNNYGQLGSGVSGPSTYRLVPIQVVGPDGTGYLTEIVAIAGGKNHSLALGSDGTVWAWGDNQFGQIGDNTYTLRTRPTRVRGSGGENILTGIVAIAAGHEHSLALRHDGTVWGWGSNMAGQLGDTTTTNKNIPVQVTGGDTGESFLTGITDISAGSLYSISLRNDGTIWCWGINNSGQLGDSTVTQKNWPVQAKGGEQGVDFFNIYNP
jgi:alpha-tubulin suppressor-like RCC1 family protein/photosystem II stability/assembly factor-like uncharacterized protein